MLPRGAERPKRGFSYFRVARKGQKENFHASARRGKTKKRFQEGLYEFGMNLYYNSIPVKTKSVILRKQTNNYI